MGKPSLLLLPRLTALLFLLLALLPLHAQTAATESASNAAATSKATPSSPSAASQAPDDATKKLTELVHAGKYAEAQQLTAGLLIAYPDDQRLVKAKAMIEKLLSAARSASADSNGGLPTNNAGSAQPAAKASAEPITGMEKVDYNALIVLARQAQQTTDLPEQKKRVEQSCPESDSL
jgi:hypothetical protein